jgi:hypothetical protein
LRAEWREEPPTMAREEAGRALDALGRAAAELKGPAADEVPPLPEELRSRWAEAYGRPAAEAGSERPSRDERRERQGQSFSEWLGALITPRRMALAGGAGAAMAAVMLMISQETDTSGSTGDLVAVHDVLRGSGRIDASDAAPVAIIAPAPAEEAKAGLLAVLREAYPVRQVVVLASANEAAAMAQKEARLVVVNLGSGLVTAWRGGQLADEFPLSAGATPRSVIDQVESADEWFDKAVPAAP